MSDGSGSLVAARYRKRPVVIEAVQLTVENEEAVREWLGPTFKRYGANPGELRINTLEGVMTANVGDWIVCGIKGEFYPVKPDIFEQSYEAVDA